ncbi:MAG: TM1266 family iron-only hydrogenase system putative regulator [Desulfocucumaceae bacterium]
MGRDIRIVGIMVEARASHGPEVQQVLTRYGSRILMRCGIPDPGRERGIITLTMQAEQDEFNSMEEELQRINGVSVKSMYLGEALG